MFGGAAAAPAMERFKLRSRAVMPAIGLGIGFKEDRTMDEILVAIEVRDSAMCRMLVSNSITNSVLKTRMCTIVEPNFARPD